NYVPRKCISSSRNIGPTDKGATVINCLTSIESETGIAVKPITIALSGSARSSALSHVAIIEYAKSLGVYDCFGA
ncbi:MAG: hypothetical protein MHPSP_003732, partial [Paramarteilia canceri]